MTLKFMYTNFPHYVKNVLVYIEHVYQWPVSVEEQIEVNKKDWFFYGIYSHTCMK